MLVFSMRLQGRSPLMVIHTKVGQGPFQLVRCRSLIFSRTLPASNLHHDRAKVQLLSILPLEWHQEDILQMSYNLRFDFWLQYMKKLNPRAYQQHLLKIPPPFLQFLPLNFFFQKFFKFFFMFTTSLLSGFNQKLQQSAIWGIPYKQGTKGCHMG